MDKQPGIEQAINAVGGQVNLAAAIGVTQQTVSAWKLRGYVAQRHISAVHAVTHVPMVELASPQVRAMLERAVS